MKKKNIFLFICTFLFILLVNLNNVSADTFEARFFAGKGGYLKYNGSPQNQEMREIDTNDKNVELTNYFVRDGYTFYGWVAERNNGETWYCNDDANSEASSCSNYQIYSSTNPKKHSYQTGENGKHAGFHAVWKNNSTGELEFPEELGKKYDYVDVMYTDETGPENETGNYLGRQSIILNQNNQLMVMGNSDNYDGWTIGVYKDWNYFTDKPDYTKIQWYCADDTLGYNCSIKKVFTSVSSIEKGNSVVVIKAHTKTIQKQTYRVMYLSENADNIGEKIYRGEFKFVDVPYDEDYKLDDTIFSREGKVIGGWYIYIYKYEGLDENGNQKNKKLCYDPNTDLTTYGPLWVKGENDYHYYFSEDNCDDPKKVRKNYKINIPLDSQFTEFTFSLAYNPPGVGFPQGYTLCVEAKWVDGQGEQSTGYTDDYYCRQQRKVWVQTGDNPSDGYCSINGLTYLKCGDIDDFPAIVPKLSSYAVTLLKTIAPIVLIIISVISLVKSMTAGKEDEIKKAQTTLVKRLIIAAIIFFVVTIVQFIMLKVADGSEQGNLSNCLSCFLNGTGDSNCSNIYYKDSDDGLVVCKWLNNHEAFMCDSGSSVPSNSENNEN